MGDDKNKGKGGDKPSRTNESTDFSKRIPREIERKSTFGNDSSGTGNGGAELRQRHTPDDKKK